MTEQQLTRFNKGAEDCKKGLSPQSNDPDYSNGYGNEYAKQQQQSQGGFN